MDVSDGIAKDIQALTPRGLVASVSPALVPVSAAARAAAKITRQPAWVHALTDGEDYELLFVVRAQTVPVAFARRWTKRFGSPLFHLGSFARKTAPGHVSWDSLHGYEHLR